MGMVASGYGILQHLSGSAVTSTGSSAATRSRIIRKQDTSPASSS